jgi:outer membrane biosynthesis protein TonB
VDVSDVLRDRMHEPGGLQQMAVVSAIAHGAIVAFVIFAPGAWFGRGADAPKTVMTISLGGGVPGPQNGGMTTIGGKAVQEAPPPEAKREAPRPPAAKTPEMTLPLPKAKPTKAVTTPVKQAPDDARGRTPSKGVPTPGSAAVDTGVRGQGFGLSTGGGNGVGSTLDVDVGTFCCPDYLIQMGNQIRANWSDQSEVHDVVMVKFTIQRSGLLTGIAVDKASRSVLNTTAAFRAVQLTRQLVPLPAEFPNPTLTVDLSFEYK